MSKKNTKIHIGGSFNTLKYYLDGEHPMSASYFGFEPVTELFNEACTTTSGYCDVITNKVYITRVVYNNPATIVFWSDGTKTVSKCHGGDVFSPEVGLTLCYLKKIVGSSELKNTIKDWMPADGKSVVTIADVRRHKKAVD